MAERFPDDGAAANGFGRLSLHEWEAYLLFEANIPAPPDMRAGPGGGGGWGRRASGIPIPPGPAAEMRPDLFAAEVDRVRALLSDE